MKLLSVLASFLVACQSCKKPDPPPQPPPIPPVQDAASPEPLQDASLPTPVPGPDASAPVDAGPADPCPLGLLGPDFRFCQDRVPTMVSVAPAAPEARGKLYHALSAATSRTKLIVRHVNGSKTGKLKIAVVLTNTGTGTGSLVLLKKGVAGPTSDFPQGESLAVGRWNSSVAARPVQVAAGKFVRFDPSVEVGLHNGYATMGLYEFSCDQPFAVDVCMLGEREDFPACLGL